MGVVQKHMPLSFPLRVKCVCVFVPRAELPRCFSLSVHVLHPVLYVCVHRVRGHPRAFCVSAARCTANVCAAAPESVCPHRSVWGLMSNDGGGGGGLISAPVECDYKQPGRRNK